MPLIPLRPLMETTIKYGFGQGGFNVNAVAQAKAVILSLIHIFSGVKFNDSY